MTSRSKFAAATLLTGALLAGCGGGGGSTSSSAIPPSSVGAGNTNSSPSPSPSAVAASYAGKVLDADHGNAPVSGASVSVGSAFTYVAGRGYVLTGITATGKTASDGSFSIATTGAMFIQVDVPGLVSAHRPLVATTNFAGYTSLPSPPTFALPTANSDELAGLAELNANRATYGSGQGAQPLTLDADVMLSARAHVLDEGTNGYYAHTAPKTQYDFSSHYVCAVGGFCANPYFVQENLDADADLRAEIFAC